MLDKCYELTLIVVKVAIFIEVLTLGTLAILVEINQPIQGPLKYSVSGGPDQSPQHIFHLSVNLTHT
jgi:hypothetical protein